MLISSALAHTTTWSPAPSEADIKCRTKIRLKTKDLDPETSRCQNWRTLLISPHMLQAAPPCARAARGGGSRWGWWPRGGSGDTAAPPLPTLLQFRRPLVVGTLL